MSMTIRDEYITQLRDELRANRIAELVHALDPNLGTLSDKITFAVIDDELTRMINTLSAVTPFGDLKSLAEYILASSCNPSDFNLFKVIKTHENRQEFWVAPVDSGYPPVPFETRLEHVAKVSFHHVKHSS